MEAAALLAPNTLLVHTRLAPAALAALLPGTLFYIILCSFSLSIIDFILACARPREGLEKAVMALCLRLHLIYSALWLLRWTAAFSSVAAFLLLCVRCVLFIFSFMNGQTSRFPALASVAARHFGLLFALFVSGETLGTVGYAVSV